VKVVPLRRSRTSQPATTISLGQGTLYLTIASLLFIASGYIIHVWLGQYLGPEAYGVYGVVIQVMTALNMVHYIGVPQAVSKYIAQDESRADAVLQSGLVLQVGSTLGIAVLFFLLAQPIARLLNDPGLTPYIRTSALVLVPYSVMTLYMTGYYNGLHQFKRQALINIAYSVAKTISVIGLVYVFHVYGAIIGFIVSPIVGLLVGVRLPRFTGERFPYGPLIRFSLPLVLFSVLSTLQLSADLFFVKALLPDAADTGYYTANQNIARIPYFAFTGAAFVLLPSISRSVSRDQVEQTRELIRRSMRYVLLLLVPSTLLISATSAQILQILYGGDYAPAAESLSLLVVGLGFVTVFGLLSNILSGAGKPRLPMTLAGLGLLVTALSCAVLVPWLGLTGAALATALGGLFSMAAAGLAVYRQFRGVVPFRSLLRIALAAVPTYLLATSIPATILLLPILYVSSLAVYLLVLTAVGELQGQDWRRAQDTLLARLPLGTRFTPRDPH
jgi:O-antigen/teichoic acid export membrane protein